MYSVMYDQLSPRSLNRSVCEKKIQFKCKASTWNDFVIPYKQKLKLNKISSPLTMGTF